MKKIERDFFTQQNLTEAFFTLGIRRGDAVLAHTSLSSLGWVCGGAEALVRALLAAVGEEGTLAMPAQSGDNTDPAGWKRPAVPAEWQAAIRENMPAFCKQTTAPRGMGRTAEMLLHWPGTVRSDHPTDSFSAVGKNAEYLMEGQPLECGLGEESPLGRMAQSGAKVLLLGVGYQNCTAFHLAEVRAGCIASGPAGSAMFENGVRVWKTYAAPEWDNSDFDRIGAAYEQTGAVAKVWFGDAMVRLFYMDDAVRFAARWMRQNRIKGRRQLVKADVAMEEELRSFCREFADAGEELVPMAADCSGEPNFSQFCKQLRKRENWAGCIEGFVPATLLLYCEESGRIVGALHIRHELNESLALHGGHIGYGVRKSERGKGIASAMLAEALPIAKSLGIERALLTCDKNNPASAQVMQKNGGAEEVTPQSEAEGIRRFWITL